MRKPYTIVFDTENSRGDCKKFAITVDNGDSADETAAIETAMKWYKKYHQMRIKSVEIIPIWDELK